MNLSRREFGRLAGAGIAAQMLSSVGARGADRKIGYCIIGLGRISMGHFMPAVLETQTSQITGLVSGHRDKALRMAAQYKVPESSIYSYEEFDKVRDNPAIDAVYVALPNSMHAEYTIRAARAGKHVLCEKPMATSVSDSKDMIQACRQANKKLMIAYRCQYEPTNLRAIQLIRDGRLGKVQAIETANGFKERLGEWRLNKKLAGGGPLMDMGIYSLNACRYLTGEEPAETPRLFLRNRSRRTVQRGGRECFVDDEVSFGNRRLGKHYVWRVHERLLPGAWVGRDNVCRARVRLSRSPPDGAF